MASTTIDTETELSAVNSILGAIGQSPVTSVSAGSANPEVAFIYNLLRDANVDVQSEGWHFNTEYHVKLTPEDTTGYLTVPTNALRYDLHDDFVDKRRDVVTRNGRLYDLVNHTDVFTGDMYVDVVTLYPFGDLPNVFQRYITYRAAVKAATQLVSNPNLVQLLTQEEGKSRAICMEYECSKGDHSYFGTPYNSVYNSYKPYHTLRR